MHSILARRPSRSAESAASLQLSFVPLKSRSLDVLYGLPLAPQTKSMPFSPPCQGPTIACERIHPAVPFATHSHWDYALDWIRSVVSWWHPQHRFRRVEAVAAACGQRTRAQNHRRDQRCTAGIGAGCCRGPWCPRTPWLCKCERSRTTWLCQWWSRCQGRRWFAPQLGQRRRRERVASCLCQRSPGHRTSAQQRQPFGPAQRVPQGPRDHPAELDRQRAGEQVAQREEARE